MACHIIGETIKRAIAVGTFSEPTKIQIIIIMDATGVALIMPITALTSELKIGTCALVIARTIPIKTPIKSPRKILYNEVKTVFQKENVFISIKNAFAVLEKVGINAGLLIARATNSQSKKSRETERIATRNLNINEF